MLFETEIVARNVCGLIDAPTGEEVEIEPLSGDEARDILDITKDRRNGTRWSVALALVFGNVKRSACGGSTGPNASARGSS